MPKDLIKKYLPDPDKIKNNKALGFLGDILHDPNLWHLHRHSVNRAFAIGLFWGCIPIPFQMLAAALFAIRFKAHLAISVTLVWFSNPLTMLPIFGFEYLVGAWILDTPAVDFHFELSLHWLTTQLYQIAIPMYFGSFLCGIILAITGFLTINTLWIFNVRKRWSQRHHKENQTGKDT